MSWSYTWDDHARWNTSLLSVTWNDQCDNPLKRPVCDLALYSGLGTELSAVADPEIKQRAWGGPTPDSAILEIVRMRAIFIRTRTAERSRERRNRGPGPPWAPPWICHCHSNKGGPHRPTGNCVRMRTKFIYYIYALAASERRKRGPRKVIH